MVMSTEPYGAFGKQMKQLATQIEDLQQQVSEIDQQVDHFSPDYREIAIVLNGE